MQFLISTAAFIVVLGVLVFVHEFGHYAVAKLCGVRVEVFSLGFGKRIWGFRKGDTDYRISILPLGGYVKMAGENPLESRTGDPGEFTSHPRWQRFLIAVAGPAMNIVFAVVVLTAVYMIHDEEPMFVDQPAVISSVAPDSPAEKVGIQAGDKIIQLEGATNPTWQVVLDKIAMNPRQPVSITVERGGKPLSLTVIPKPVGRDQTGSIGVFPEEPILAAAVTPGSPAEKAGVREGDEIANLNGTPIRSAHTFISLLQENKDKPVELTLLRGDQTIKTTAVPQYSDDKETGNKRYLIGVNLKEKNKIIQLPAGPALSKALADSRMYSGLIFELAGKLVQQKVSLKTVSGPIGIAQISGDAARQGWDTLIKVMALISLNLAIFNLFPIPILDGGLMLMLLIEGIMRRDINQQVKERVYQAAFVFLVLFAVVVIYNDVAKTLS